VLQDVRFALRLFNAHRGYALTAILTIALGIGANTAIFSIADSVLFRPLPFADADRLFAVRIGDVKTKQTYGFLPWSAIEALRASAFADSIGGAESRAVRLYVRGDTGLDVLSVTPVSRDYLDLLDVRPILGRRFDASDVGSRAVLLSYGAWMRQFGGDPSVVGSVIPAAVRTMDVSALPDSGFRIVGVLPPRLRLPLFTALDGMTLMEERTGGTMASFTPLVRVKEGVTAAAAEAQLGGVQGEELVPGKTALRLVPVREELAARQDPVLWLLLSATTIVLLVACVNLANLMLARGSARERELSVRAALGGSRIRLVRLLVVEGACLAAIGTAAGLIVGSNAFTVLVAQLPPLLARTADPQFDGRALAFAILTACVATIGFSLVPAIRLSRAEAGAGLRLGQLQRSAPKRGRSTLIAVEVAICLALLVGAGLVGRSLVRLISEDLGFASKRLAVTFDLPTMVVKRGDVMRADTVARSAYVRARLEQIRTAPGVRAAGLGSAAPYSGVAPEAPLSEQSIEQGGGVYSVSSGYFQAIGMPLLAGRDLTDQESFNAAPVGVLNERAARAMCGEPSSCVGRIVRSPRQPARTVVGVVADARRSLGRSAIPAMYVPFDVTRFALAAMVIDADDTAASRDAVKRALTASPDARVVIRSIEESRDAEVAPFRFNATVVGAFALLTLALSIVGVYGVMSAVVGERTREYGIRLALGATRERVNRLVLRQALAPIALGSAGGLLLASWGSRSVASLLYGVAPMDTPSFVVAAAVVAMAGFGAALIPARRAGRVDPIVALKAE
jgi:predicted permease